MVPIRFVVSSIFPIWGFSAVTTGADVTATGSPFLVMRKINSAAKATIMTPQIMRTFIFLIFLFPFITFIILEKQYDVKRIKQGKGAAVLGSLFPNMINLLTAAF